MGQRVVETVEKLALPVIENEGLNLIDVEYKKEGSNWFLRLFIHHPTIPIDTDICGRVSQALSQRLDEVDPIAGPYILEVCSSGGSRLLRSEADFKEAIAKRIVVNTYQAVEGSKKLEGKLVDLDQEQLWLAISSGDQATTQAIPRTNIAKAQLILDEEKGGDQG